MNLIHNKHGTDFDVGSPATRRPRDGIEGMPRDGPERRPCDGPERRPRDGPERRPRDGPERRPRDGPERRPRDGPERRSRDGPLRRPRDGPLRRPRDKPILWKDSLVIRYFYRSTDRIQDARIHCRSSSKWQTLWWKKIGLTDQYGRGMSWCERTVNSE